MSTRYWLCLSTVRTFAGMESFSWTLSTSDFAGDGNRPQRASRMDRHQRRRESRANTRACRRRSRVLFQKAAIRYRRNHLFPIGPKMQLLLPKRISLSVIEGQAVITLCDVEHHPKSTCGASFDRFPVMVKCATPTTDDSSPSADAIEHPD